MTSKSSGGGSSGESLAALCGQSGPLKTPRKLSEMTERQRTIERKRERERESVCVCEREESFGSAATLVAFDVLSTNC